MCHLGALWTGVSRCPRTYSGRASGVLERSVCTVGFPRTPTDGRAGSVSRLDVRR